MVVECRLKDTAEVVRTRYAEHEQAAALKVLQMKLPLLDYHAVYHEQVPL
jgi:hypothetical protein